MEKHLLVTVSDDLSCLCGARFVGSFFKNKSEIKITLFYVAPLFDYMERGKTPYQRQTEQKINDAYRDKGQNALDEARKYFLSRGFNAEHIHAKLVSRQLGTVKDIVHEGRKGLYDAVVLGRRGYAVFEGVFTDSISKGMLDQEIDFPIWVCRHPEEGRKNVLLCVDGSEPSLRIADHVGFILEKEEHTVTLLHVDTEETKTPEEIVEEARKKLLDNHFPEERIKTAVVSSSRIVNTVLEEMERGSYAVVAVGRAGQHKGLLKNWLVGSRSMKLLEMLDKAVLWVSK